MSDVTKLFIFTAATFILVVVIGTEFYWVRKGVNELNESNSELIELSSNLQKSLAKKIDKEEFSGSDVINYIQMYHGTIPMVVATINNSGFYEFDSIYDIKSDTYIHPNAEFIGNVIKTTNGNLKAVTFNQKNAHLAPFNPDKLNQQTAFALTNKKLDFISCDLYYSLNKYQKNQKEITDLQKMQEETKNEILSANADSSHTSGSAANAIEHRNYVINRQVQEYSNKIQKEKQYLNELKTALTKKDTSILEKIGG